jgi:hypothetical protein
MIDILKPTPQRVPKILKATFFIMTHSGHAEPTIRPGHNLGY